MYHGSKISGIKILQPSQNKAVNEKPVVFATDNKAYALALTYGTGNELAISFSNDEMYIDELIPGKLSLLDKVGYLYEIDGKYFEKSPEGLDGEFISYQSVPTQKEIKIKNLLGELKNMGVHLVPYDEVPESMKERGEEIEAPTMRHDLERFR